jgi:Zn-dependent peptidase ImmA (M78 family)
MARIPEYQYENEACKLRARFLLGDRLPVDVESLLIDQGILTFYTPMSESFSGMCLKYDESTNFILINSNMVMGRQNFTVAHELYHLFVQDPKYSKVHACDINNPHSPIERHANSFASYFLLPTAGVVDIMQRLDCTKKSVNPAHIITMCGYFGVSYQAMLIRLNKILKLPDDRFNELWSIQPVTYAEQCGLKTDVFLVPNRDNVIVGDYASKAQALYDAGKISKGHFIELMSDIKFEENGKDKDSFGLRCRD